MKTIKLLQYLFIHTNLYSKSLYETSCRSYYNKMKKIFLVKN